MTKRPGRWSLLQFCTVLLLCIPRCLPAQTTSVPGYDVFLLAGQSNMAGTGTGVDLVADGAVNPRIWQWDGATSQIVPARDPLYAYGGSQTYVGPGLTFAKAYLATLPTNRQVLLVNAASGGTSFASGFWKAPNGGGAQTAVLYANAAMAAAGPGARLAGILWHQGESDILSLAAASYESNLLTLFSYFKANITGATSTTPIVVGEMSPDWLVFEQSAPTVAAQALSVQEDFHQLPDVLPYNAWTSGELLSSDYIYGQIHYSAISQRAFGRRYAERFFYAAKDLPQPQLSLKAWAGAFYDDGRGLLALSALPNNPAPAVTGTVAPVYDPLRGNVAQIAQGMGFLTVTAPAGLFSGSYTKLTWFKSGLSASANYLIAASNPGQTHFLQAQSTGNGSLAIAAGHASAGSVANVAATVPLASGTWIQIAQVYDAVAKTMTLYANGAQVAVQGAVAAAPAPSGASATLPVYVGSLAGVGGSVDGSLAGTRVWSSALTAAQIAALYSYEATSTPAGLVFGTLNPTAPATQTYTYTPTSGAAISSLAVLTEGVPAGDYALASSSTCAPGTATSCTAAVTFAPHLAGLRRGALQITDSSGAQTNVYLAGAGGTTPSYGTPHPSVLVAGLSGPSGVAVDGAGNVYSANRQAGTVTEFNPSGALLRTISGLNSPVGLALDGAGNLYTAESGSADIVKVLPGATGFSAFATGFNSNLSPQGLATDGAGNVYVADTFNGVVVELSPNGQSHIVTTGALTLTLPAGVAVDAAGNLFIADFGNGRIVEVPVTGAANTKVYAAGFQNPTGVAVDAAGNLFVTDLAASTLYEVATGTSSPVAIATGLSNAYSVTAKANGDLYVADSGNGRILQLQRGAAAPLTAQTIAFSAVASALVGQSGTLTPTATSGLPVTLTSSTPAVCTVAGYFASAVGAGTCTIVATQTGNSSFAAATPVSVSIAIYAGYPQTITWGGLPAQVSVGASGPLPISVSSGLPITITSSTPAVCTVSGLIGTAIARGTCTFVASQAGNGTFAAATPVSRSLTVGP